MKTRIHINLTVSDLSRSIAFYETLFGAAPTKRRDDYANWRLDTPALHLALVQSPVPGQPVADSHARHFGVELFELADLTDWQKRAKQAGMQLRTEEQVTCCYAVGTKFWAADPDGNQWEFWVRHAEADSMRGDDDHDDEAPASSATPMQAGCCTPAGATAKAGKASCC